jgi:hypothetical protein
MLSPTVKIILGGLLGAAAGYAWHRLVGCRTGACPITANPWISSVYGLVMGLLLTGSF